MCRPCRSSKFSCLHGDVPYLLVTRRSAGPCCLKSATGKSLVWLLALTELSLTGLSHPSNRTCCRPLWASPRASVWPWQSTPQAPLQGYFVHPWLHGSSVGSRAAFIHLPRRAQRNFWCPYISWAQRVMQEHYLRPSLCLTILYSNSFHMSFWATRNGSPFPGSQRSGGT